MFILNKGISLSAFILLACNFGFGPMNNLGIKIPQGWLNAGIIAFVILWGYNMSFQTFLREDKAFIQFITSRKFLIVALLFGALHITFMGYEGWLKPEGWYGGMPPASLVAIVIFAISYIANLFGRK